METGNEALPEMIKKIIESPEIADILNNSGIKASPDKDEETQKPLDLSALLPLISGAAPQKEESGGSSPALPPELLKLLPQVMGALKGSSAPADSGGSASGGTPDKNRQALLKALKPYMSERRRGVIDTMLQLNSLTDIMTSLTGRNV